MTDHEAFEQGYDLLFTTESSSSINDSLRNFRLQGVELVTLKS